MSEVNYIGANIANQPRSNTWVVLIMRVNTYTPGFELIEVKRAPWNGLVASFALNSALVIAILLIPVTVSRTLEPAQPVTSVTLIAPPPVTPYIPAPRPRIVKPISIPPPAPVKAVQKQFEAPPVKAPEIKTVKLPPAPVETPKPVEVAKFEAPKIQLPQRDVFPATAEPAPPPAPVKVVKTGGFGDPNGVSVNPSSNKPSALVQAGSFDLSPGSGRGSGGGSNGKALVASAGFGDSPGVSGGSASGGHGNGGVQAGGFGDYAASAGPAARAVAHNAAPVQTPVEITYKPKPAYTPEAREKKIEGDVQLEVLFSSGGQIQVLRTIRGLGYGLDENARQAASQIRFRPGTRNGIPVDMTGTVHIVFQIS